jgi:hypothetical protein
MDDKRFNCLLCNTFCKNKNLIKPQHYTEPFKMFEFFRVVICGPII